VNTKRSHYQRGIKRMTRYEVQEEYKISYICWKCEKATIHELEKCLVGYPDSFELTYLSFCPECDKYEEFSDLSELEEKQGLRYFHLLDLERTLRMGEPYFWKQSKQGYVNFDEFSEAGQFNEIEAFKMVDSDLDKMTLMLEVGKIKKLLKIED
jgi:hypothetical protein